MKTLNNILLVRVPTLETVNGRELRDYILESLAQGVLVLTEDASCEVMELPRWAEWRYPRSRRSRKLQLGR